jgi:hypothetical protein
MVDNSDKLKGYLQSHINNMTKTMFVLPYELREHTDILSFLEEVKEENKQAPTVCNRIDIVKPELTCSSKN